MGSVAAGNDDIWRISGDWLVGKYGSPMSPRPQCHKALREQGPSGATGLEGIPHALVFKGSDGRSAVKGRAWCPACDGPSPAWRVQPRPAMMPAPCSGTLGRDVDTPTPSPAP